MRYWLNLSAMAVLSLTLTLFILVIYASNRWVQSYLYPARIIPTGDWLKENNIPYQEIELITKDGIKLAAWYTPSRNGAVILVVHGYNASRLENIYVMLAKMGMAFWHGTSAHTVKAVVPLVRLDIMSNLMWKPRWIMH